MLLHVALKSKSSVQSTFFHNSGTNNYKQTRKINSNLRVVHLFTKAYTRLNNDYRRQFSYSLPSVRRCHLSSSLKEKSQKQIPAFSQSFFIKNSIPLQTKKKVRIPTCVQNPASLDHGRRTYPLIIHSFSPLF